ncbi:MAG: hypothetical protein FWF76_05565 [Oscillospiraceae bacterium]|nr:hypothetical protein [Oscillospiraceae bacterium]
MVIAKKSPFERAVEQIIVLDFRKELLSLPRELSGQVCEIRLRAGRLLTLELASGKRIRLNKTVTPTHINDCLCEFCGQSIHSYEKQFKEGWLTLKGGHRVGFAGTAVVKAGNVENIRNFSSINLRIAKEYIDCADGLYTKVISSENLHGLLLIGKPMSAKTTILRDLCRLLSKNHKIALIDERSEIAAVHDGVPALNVGENTDVLNNFPKSDGIMTALRNLSPEYLFCDEIGWEKSELKSLKSLTNSGVKMVLTAHSGSIKEAYSSPRICKLLNTGGISHVALLGSNKELGRVKYYGRINEFNKPNEFRSADCNNHFGDSGRSVFFATPEKP